MMGEHRMGQNSLFYRFSLESHVPEDHLLRVIDKFAGLGFMREHLKAYYSHAGRPSIDPELMIRMLLIGYCFGIRSERRLCEEVHLNLAYRWFCRLGSDGDVPDHFSFFRNRHGRFRDSQLLRELFETTAHRCIEEGLAGGENFAVDASRIGSVPFYIMTDSSQKHQFDKGKWQYYVMLNQSSYNHILLHNLNLFACSNFPVQEYVQLQAFYQYHAPDSEYF